MITFVREMEYFFFHSFIFCIEIKGTKFNPDPIKENSKEVKESYNDAVKKVKCQVLRVKEKLKKENFFEILKKDRELIEKIKIVEDKKVIGICIFFEDIGKLLVGISNYGENIIYMSYYDLIIVFIYLNNPFLITKYLLERSLLLENKHLYIDDELTYLYLFNNYIDLSRFINIKLALNDLKECIMFDNRDFCMIVENHFRKYKKKPPIKINNLIMRAITSNNYSSIDGDLFFGLFSLLSMSYENWNALEEMYKEKNKSNSRLPIFIIFSHKNEKFALMFISRAHNPYQEKQSSAHVKKFFGYKESINHLYLVSIGKDYSDYKRIDKNNKMFLDINENELLSGMNFSIAQCIFPIEEKV